LLKAKELASKADPLWDANAGTWIEVMGNDGVVYWMNELTGVTTYENPNVEEVAQWDEYAGGEYGEGESYDYDYYYNNNQGQWGSYGVEGGLEEWTAAYDQTGITYWYNNWTGESTYDEPPNLPVGDWAEYYDEENALPYWYNQVTGESTYDNPNGPMMIESAGDWVEGYDENALPYWYNQVTGESTYDNPNGPMMIESAGDWVEGYDENGIQYWYNQVTGETSYGDDGGEWVQEVDESGVQYWLNKTTGETSYEEWDNNEGGVWNYEEPWDDNLNGGVVTEYDEGAGYDTEVVDEGAGYDTEVVDEGDGYDTEVVDEGGGYDGGAAEEVVDGYNNYQEDGNEGAWGDGEGDEEYEPVY
jgi:hypothetical protein